jgi:lipopolysaccharide transport system ATP-binding protein
MSRPAIVVDDLSKSYRLGVQSRRADSLREAITQVLASPLRRFREASEVNADAKETFWALKGVSFEVQPGEVVGIIGRNGAGKSTLLKILSRIVEPTTGCIRLRGRVASLLEVGTGFHPELTGRENIFLNGSILGMKHAEIARKFDEIVEFAEVSKFLDTPVKRYSSGMYVRLAFAVAAHLEPEILIIDEVLAVGDTAFQQKCLGKVKNMTVGGDRTVLFVSHNLTTVRSLCSRVIWLKSGNVAWNGAVGPAVEQYLTEDLGESNNSFDVARTERNHVKETPVRLLRITFNEGEPVRHGEPLTIDVDYQSTRAVEAVAFGVGFSSPEGGRVMCVDTDIPGDRRIDVPANVSGRVRMVVHENYLQPSRYALAATARSGDNHGLDYLPYFAQLEVLEGDNTPAVLIGRNEAGCVRMPAEWVHAFDCEGSMDGTIEVQGTHA